jgi:hypothetical protein
MAGCGSCQRDVCEESKWEHGDVCLAFMLEGRGPDSQVDTGCLFDPTSLGLAGLAERTAEVSSSSFVVVSRSGGSGVDRYGDFSLRRDRNELRWTV